MPTSHEIPGARAAQLQQSFRREVTIGLAIVLTFFVGFGSWAGVARLDAAVVAPAVVTVTGSRQAVQHQDGGIVSRIHVREGQQVASGDLLLELDSTDLAARERILSSQVIAASAVNARLTAERTLQGTITRPAVFARLEGDDARAAEAALSGEMLQFEARRQSHQSEIAILQQRVQQLLAQIEGASAQAISQDDQARLIADQLEAIRALHEDGFASLTQVRALEREAAAIQGRSAEYRAAAARSREEIGGTELQVLQLERARQEAIAEDLQEIDLQLSRLLPEWEAVRAQLERTRVRAPAGGRIVGLNVHTEGGVIAPGQMLMEIVPEDRPLILQARISPENIEDVQAGAEVEIRLTAYARNDAPVLHGVLTNVSADRLQDATTGAPYYLAEVELPVDEIAQIRSIRAGTSNLLPGMPAEVLIPLRPRTMLQYLFDPFGDLMWRSMRES